MQSDYTSHNKLSIGGMAFQQTFPNASSHTQIHFLIRKKGLNSQNLIFQK